MNCPCGKPTHSKGMCRTCYNRKWNMENRRKAAWYHLRANAKAREIECTVTWDQWNVFCDETGYMDECGRGNDFATADRRSNNNGYHFWNIQKPTLRKNIHKYYSEDRYDKSPPPPEETYCEAIPQTQIVPEKIIAAQDVITGIAPHFNL